MRNSNKTIELQKKNYLKQLSNWAKDLDKKIEESKKNIGEKEAKKERLAAELNENNKQTISRITELEKSLENLKLIYESKLKEKNSLEEAIRKRTEILNDSSSKLRDVEAQINIMKLNLDMQENTYAMKKERRDALRKHLEDLINSEQTFRLTEDDQETKLELIDQLMQRSALLKNEEFESTRK